MFIAEIVSQGLPLEARDKVGRTALYAAAEKGSLPAVSILLKAGAEIDAPSLDGTTLVQAAASHAHGQIFRTLLERRTMVRSADPVQTAMDKKNATTSPRY